MAEVRDLIQWWSCVCTACGERQCVPQHPKISEIDFMAMLLLIYGDPPVCPDCDRLARQG
jgi:hypothetical protein